mgnify:CR=1 FL=1
MWVAFTEMFMSAMIAPPGGMMMLLLMPAGRLSGIAAPGATQYSAAVVKERVAVKVPQQPLVAFTRQ